MALFFFFFWGGGEVAQPKTGGSPQFYCDCGILANVLGSGEEITLGGSIFFGGEGER